MTRHHVRLDQLPGQRRALVRLTGPDAARFLQGTLTGDVTGAPRGRAVAAALCTAKGRIVSEIVVLPVAEDVYDLLVPHAEADGLVQLLDRHIIMDQVEVARSEDPAVAVVWGDDEADLAAPAGDVRHFAARHPGPGQLWIGTDEALARALDGIEAVDAHGWARRRIDTATPAWGHEITADTFPAEVGFVYAVSYTKGCFLGQEPLARVHARGQVNRVMVRARCSGALAEDTVLATDERPKAGRVSTVAKHGDASVALAVVRRDIAVPGTVVQAPEGTDVEITSEPLGDDPGVAGRGKPATVKLGGGRR